MMCLTNKISAELEYHLEQSDSLMENVFMYGSASWGKLIREVRALYNLGLIDDLDEEDFFLLESDAGELAEFEGNIVMLDTPETTYDVPGDTGDSIVYVKGPSGIEKIHVTVPKIVTT